MSVRELATTVEIKENDALRELKDQNIKLKRNSHSNQMKRTANQAGLDYISHKPFSLEKEELPKPMTGNEDKDLLHSSTSVHGSLYKKSIPSADDNMVIKENLDPGPVSCPEGNNKDGVSCALSMGSGKRHRAHEVPSKVDDEVICLDDTNPVQSSAHNVKETSSLTPVSQPGTSKSISSYFILVVVLITAICSCSK